ncbi:MAG TPA: hypothetical protein DDZ88_27945 [Verrucomicrobiales bacterium]|nr:hypothetical protein [Verrucomicrobiales bacterium]
MPKFSLKLLDAFRRSAALQRIAADEVWLRQVVKDDARKIIPVAEVARWLGVSSRQIWNWIELGWINTYKRPSESYKKGISKPAFTRFLNRVREQAKIASEMLSAVPRGRPPTARVKLREAYYHTQTVTAGMTPKECAAALGISTDSVRRACRQEDIPSFNPTMHRYRVGRLGSRPRAKKRV